MIHVALCGRNLEEFVFLLVVMATKISDAMPWQKIYMDLEYF